MILGRVTGTVHASVGSSHLKGERLLVVRGVDLEQKPEGKPLVCLDRADAGPGDLVLVNREGGAARILYGNDRLPVQGIVLGVVDQVELNAGW